MTRQPPAFENRLKEAVMEHVRKNGHRTTPVDIERRISARFSAPAGTVRKVVKSLVMENRLAYTQQLGRTFVEISLNRPVHIGEGLVLAPPDISFVPGESQTLIRIAPGASFGLGDHATTRIALQLTARAVRNHVLPCRLENACVLDIGTGTGVLAIAACLMGAGRAVGIDTDGCARTEAAENVRLNGMEDRIHIREKFECSSSGMAAQFHLILANLRYPTLVGISDKIGQVSAPGAPAVFSGFRRHESADIVRTFSTCGFLHQETLFENNWCGMVLKKQT